MKLRLPAENIFLLVSRISTDDLVFVGAVGMGVMVDMFYLLVLGLVGLARLVGLVWELRSWLRDDKLCDVLSTGLLFTLWDRSWRLSRLVAK